VTVMTDPETAKLVHTASIESMTYSGGDIRAFLDKKSAVLIGPGLPDTDRAYNWVRETVASIELPTVIDASALNAYAGRANELNAKNRARVLTPHPGEMRRLLGKEVGDRVETAREAAKITNCVVVLKGHQTLIAGPDGQVNVNQTGNPGMASGGMGDVLGGMIAAFIARGVDPYDAACAAVYIHGYAGDLLKDEMGDTGLAAMDLAEHIPQAIQKLR